MFIPLLLFALAAPPSELASEVTHALALPGVAVVAATDPLGNPQFFLMDEERRCAAVLTGSTGAEVAIAARQRFGTGDFCVSALEWPRARLSLLEARLASVTGEMGFDLMSSIVTLTGSLTASVVASVDGSAIPERYALSIALLNVGAIAGALVTNNTRAAPAFLRSGMELTLAAWAFLPVLEPMLAVGNFRSLWPLWTLGWGFVLQAVLDIVSDVWWPRYDPKALGAISARLKERGDHRPGSRELDAALATVSTTRPHAALLALPILAASTAALGLAISKEDTGGVVIAGGVLAVSLASALLRGSDHVEPGLLGGTF